MTPKIIKHYIILLVVFFSWINLAHANVIINEFVSSPTDGIEWIELLNTTGSPIVLNGWKLVDGNDKVTDDLILNGTISANGFIVFENSKSWLNNDGDTIILKDNSSNTIDSVIYGTDGIIKAPAKDKSGVLISGKWITNQDPTKNLPNSDSSNNSLDENTSDTTDENIDPTPLVKNNPEILKITTKIISPKIITAGIPFLLSSLTTTNRGETYTVGNFVWNFGDGMVRKVGDSSSFEYIYEYPGEYALTLSYFDSTFSQIADATNRITIKVIPSEIFISSVGSASDPYIEIENKSSSEIILSNWIVTAGTHYFIIPEETTLLPNKKIKLSPKITGFVGGDIASVVITDPNKEITATYPTETKKLTSRVSSVSKVVSYINPIQADSSSLDDDLSQDSQVINLNDLGASAGESGSNIPKSIYPIIGLLVVIGIGVASFLLIKKKNSVEDYIEKGIRVEDMTIIE
ncbi:MAG: lamin tail domain-containing protein [Candidatus Paceibacterota bacterium]